jgi:4,4'-diaponeurosporenoate glycosyltransferase
LHSLQLQKFQDFEVIVVANGCTDGTEEIVRKRVGEKEGKGKLKLFSLSKAHVSLARNCGADHAKGEVLVFLDADTELEHDTLLRIQERFRSPEAGGSSSCSISVATTLVRADKDLFRYKVAMGLKNLQHRLGLYKGCSGILVCRADDFKEVGGYDAIVVREQRKLILKLLKLGRGGYVCIPAYVITSMRRFEVWGIRRAILFWIRQWMKDKTKGLDKSEYECVR